MVNRFSSKARRYMIGYMHKVVTENNGEISSKDDNEWSYEYNEKVHRVYKSHRDPCIFDFKYVNKVVNKCIGVKSE